MVVNIPKAPCKRTQRRWVLHVVSVSTPCCMACFYVLLEVVSQSLKPVKLRANSRNNSQQCWELLGVGQNRCVRLHRA